MVRYKLSIIVPVYNVEEYLPACLDSILSQNYEEFEVICVNDGSTDNSWKILDEYESKDNRIKVVKQKNKGLSEARNVGLDHASGEWILFVDSDDKLGCYGVTTGHELQELMAQIEDGVDWIITTPTIIYEKDIYLDKRSGDEKYFTLPFYGVRNSKDNEVEKINVCAWGKLYKHEVINEGRLRFPSGLRYEDEFWFPCYRLISNRVKCVETKLYTYYRRGGGIMYNTYKTKKIKNAEERLLIAEKVIAYYLDKNSLNTYKEYLDSIFWKLFCSSNKLSPANDVLYCQWLGGHILRKLDYPCLNNRKLMSLKNGEVVLMKKIGFLKRIFSLLSKIIRFRI